MLSYDVATGPCIDLLNVPSLDFVHKNSIAFTLEFGVIDMNDNRANESNSTITKSISMVSRYQTKRQYWEACDNSSRHDTSLVERPVLLKYICLLSQQRIIFSSQCLCIESRSAS